MWVAASRLGLELVGGHTGLLAKLQHQAERIVTGTRTEIKYGQPRPRNSLLGSCLPKTVPSTVDVGIVFQTVTLQDV